jgi:2-polyprenyl-6-methoxyphenol hydroxylase-like FAD-dependent oxidoreductase
MSRVGCSAVVLGASMAGLLAARVLSRHFQRVTLVERDVLPEGEALRKGVPQTVHAHALLNTGYAVLDDYFPGMMDAIVARGAPRGDLAGDFLWFQYGRWKMRETLGLPAILASRACLEAAVRRRVKAIGNVAFLEGAEGLRPVFDPDAGRVTGLRVRGPDRGREETLAADLVVDATGRGSAAPKWLEAWGFGRPEERSVRVHVGYATRNFERRPGDLFDASGAIVAGTPPSSKRLAAVNAIEDGQWKVTLAGILGDHPPMEEEGWQEFAASLPVPAVHDLVTSARPLTSIASYRFPANQRRLYERMRRFPGGFLVLGDAVSSFNPVYGQGMSVAALEARALDECLGRGLGGLTARFHARLGPIVDIPWAVAPGEELRLPEVGGRRPPGFRLLNRYLERVHAAASVDPVVCRRFFDVVNLRAAPSSLMAPRIAARVLARTVRP